jgi:hypothetical protein
MEISEEVTDVSKISSSVKESFIFDNINDLPIEDRKYILQILYNSQYRSKLIEKGNGIQIKINDLAQDMIDKIYIAIVNKLNDQTINF